jgi:hypothetical protein
VGGVKASHAPIGNTYGAPRDEGPLTVSGFARATSPPLRRGEEPRLEERRLN